MHSLIPLAGSLTLGKEFPFLFHLEITWQIVISSPRSNIESISWPVPLTSSCKSLNYRLQCVFTPTLFSYILHLESNLLTLDSAHMWLDSCEIFVELNLASDLELFPCACVLTGSEVVFLLSRRDFFPSLFRNSFPGVCVLSSRQCPMTPFLLSFSPQGIWTYLQIHCTNEINHILVLWVL